MPRDPRFDILFEPVRIGPKVARNRFFQVPHASGMTNAAPHVRAAFRETKAEGGWAVVSTGACSIHSTSDDSPFPCATLWDEADLRSHALMTEAAHRHGSLAAIELWHGGAAALNRTTRHAPLSPSGIPWMATHVGFMSSARPKVMDAQDIRDLIRWHADAAVMAERAGFDILYVYAGMGYLPYQFLLSDYNHRTDDYGGSVRNRVRLVEQLIDAVREATHGRCAVALRISMQELRSRPSDVAPSEAHEVITHLKDAPDLFDVKMDYSATDCAASRYTPEGSHEPVVDFLKTITDKPVVGVGRFTSPDTMVSMVKRGVLDLIGGARPSIADPFLPKKIEEGRVEDIRECIGCNLCISSWHDGVWVRCTQNPTAGEEWRRGWHPEIVRRDGKGQVLVVGAGPAGLEAALTLARRGHDVALADKARDFGGRLRWESRLPGLGQWHRVVDYRMGQLRKLPNVTLYPESDLSAQDVRDFGAAHTVIATGARWLPHLCGANELPSTPLVAPNVYTPDDIAAGTLPEGPVAVFDYDNYYLGSAIAEHLAGQGRVVTYITTAGAAAAWGFMTNEQPLVHQSFARKGIALRTLEVVTGFDGETLALAQIFSGDARQVAARSLVIVGYRQAGSALYEALANTAAPGTLHLTGDALAPGAIVHAVYQGHKTARELGVPAAQVQPRRDAPFAPRDFVLPEAAGMTRVEGRRRQSGRPSGGVPQRPFGQVERRIDWMRVISDDQVAAIHQAALEVLAGQGMRVLHPPARDLFAQAGAQVQGETVRIDPALVAERLASVPATFTIEARNPAKSLTLGGSRCVYASVGGPAYVMCNDHGRRDGTFAEMRDFLRLVQALNVIHQEGGGPFEPLDLPANTRHLDIYHAQIRHLDKSWQTQTLGHARTMDGIEMAAIMLGTTPEGLRDRPVLLGIINTNSPLQLDVPMAEGLIAMAAHGQVNVITPFTLAGAMAPVTLAGALVLQHAEAMAGIVLTQIVRPGVPVMYGGFTSNVDMRSGSPAFGTPEYAKAAQASGQLARHIGVPFRSSNVTAANAVDAQAAYESQMALWGALTGGAHLLEHAAGWLHGGLTASFEKLILDAEMLQMMDAWFEPLSTSDADLALDAILEAGAGGHFFGTAHTMERYEHAFHAPMVSNWDNYPNWLQRGGIDARARANTVWKDLLAQAEDPPLDPGIDEALTAYVARRKAEGGAPMN